jgi:hypothetical protein
MQISAEFHGMVAGVMVLVWKPYLLLNDKKSELKREPGNYIHSILTLCRYDLKGGLEEL